MGGLGGFEEAGGKADFAPNYLRLASARSCSASVDRKCRPRRSPNTLRNGDTFAVSYPRARRAAGGCRQGSDAHRGHRASRDRQRGVLDSRNVRVSIPAPGGPSAFSVWRRVGNVVLQPSQKVIPQLRMTLALAVTVMTNNPR